MLSLLSGILPKLLGIGSMIAAGVAVLFAARRSGVDAQRSADLKQTVKEVETAHAAENDVARLSDDAVREQLRRQWTRDQ